MATAVNTVNYMKTRDAWNVFWIQTDFQEFFQASILTYQVFLAAYFIEQPGPEDNYKMLKENKCRENGQNCYQGTIKKAKSMKNHVLQVCEEKDKCCEKMIPASAQDEKCRASPSPQWFPECLFHCGHWQSFLHLLLRIFSSYQVSKYLCHQRAPQFWILMSLMSQGCPAHGFLLFICPRGGAVGSGHLSRVSVHGSSVSWTWIYWPFTSLVNFICRILFFLILL